LTASAPFTLSDLLKLRCFDSLGFSLGLTKDKTFAAIADLATSPIAQHLLETFTEGPIRYRLDFSNAGHQRAAVRELATLIYKKSPDLLNGGGDTPWTFEIHSTNRAHRVELVPKIIPDPRFAYRRRDIPAASHPPLAASMARLSLRSSSAWEGERLREPSPSASSNFPTTSKSKSSSPIGASHVNPRRNRRDETLTSRVPIGAGNIALQEIIWDPFCGSGLELIERSLLGGVKKIIGTDLSPVALQIAQQNFAAANLTGIQSEFVVSDFRNFDPGPVSVIITNPPLGRRVPIPNLSQLIADLFETAARHLVPGGQLIFVNPINIAPRSPALQRELSQLVDFGGFHCLLEKYILTDRKPAPSR
jgi:SAM-dependent methyltransferase